MFKQFKNIDTAFRQVRRFTFIVITGSFLLCCFAIYKSFKLVNQVQGRIYILANGKALEAFSSQRNENIPVEARDHVKNFHQFFFTLDPDDKVIQANITRALYLADGSAKKEYDNLKENGYYSNIISGNISQQISADSVVVDMNAAPIGFRYYGTLTIIRSTSTVSRSLITEGVLRNVSRSDNNPHGFLIERWTTIENKDLKIINR